MNVQLGIVVVSFGIAVFLPIVDNVAPLSMRVAHCMQGGEFKACEEFMADPPGEGACESCTEDPVFPLKWIRCASEPKDEGVCMDFVDLGCELCQETDNVDCGGVFERHDDDMCTSYVEDAGKCNRQYDRAKQVAGKGDCDTFPQTCVAK